MAGTPGEQKRSTPRGPLARRWLRASFLAALVCLSLGLLITFFWPWRAEPAQPPTQPGGVSAAPPASPSAPASASPRDDDALPPSIKRYLEATVYPPGAGRLTEAHSDLIHPNERYEDYRRILATYSENPDEVVSVRLTSDHFFYTGDEVVLLDLKVKRGEWLVDPISVEAYAHREGRAGPEGNRVPIRFLRQDDGRVAELDTASFADHHGPIVVNARIEYQRGAFYDESLRFFFTPPGRIPARFTGKIQDELRDGSLMVEIGIEVEQAGFYRIDANLYDRFGSPIGFSSYKGSLTRSDRFVPIQFFGRILRDAGARSPYAIGEIRGYRFLDGQYPDRERIPDLAGRHVTANYALDRFSDADYTSEQKDRMVRLLLEDVANGWSIDQPPLPAATNSAAPDSS